MNWNMTRRRLLAIAPALLPAKSVLVAGEPAASPQTMVDRLLDKVIANEHQVLKSLSQRTPIVETYLQEDPSSGDEAGKTRDHYFLGRMGLLDSVNYVSFIKRSSSPPALETKTKSRFLFFKKTVTTAGASESLSFLPEGFAQMAVIDARFFDRKTYKFDYIRREFLGDVRCLVFDLSPFVKGQPGKFIGRIWVEDQDSFIVRINGTYTPKSDDDLYFHFDSWRVNPEPRTWIPAITYVEDAVSFADLQAQGFEAPVRFKAQTRIWSYESPTHNRFEELTAILVDSNHNVTDQEAPKEISPIEGQRRWEREAELNVTDRLEKIGLLAPQGEVDKVLNTVVNNLIVTNPIDVDARCRLLLTTPLETFTIGHTIVISRGLVDVLPDEGSLALVLATELAHIALAHPTRTEYSFNDRTMVGDEEVLDQFRFSRTPEEVAGATQKALIMLANSPYKDKLSGAGLFLRAMKAASPRVPRLIQATLGNDLTKYLEMPEFSDLLSKAPKLEEDNLQQVAALPLGSRIRVEPWNNQAFLLKSKPLALLSAREKMPFEVAPVTIHLSRAASSAPVASN